MAVVDGRSYLEVLLSRSTEEVSAKATARTDLDDTEWSLPLPDFDDTEWPDFDDTQTLFEWSDRSIEVRNELLAATRSKMHLLEVTRSKDLLLQTISEDNVESIISFTRNTAIRSSFARFSRRLVYRDIQRSSCRALLEDHRFVDNFLFSFENDLVLRRKVLHSFFQESDWPVERLLFLILRPNWLDDWGMRQNGDDRIRIDGIVDFVDFDVMRVLLSERLHLYVLHYFKHFTPTFHNREYV